MPDLSRFVLVILRLHSAQESLGKEGLVHTSPTHLRPSNATSGKDI